MDLTLAAGRSKPGGAARGAPLGLPLLAPVSGTWQGGLLNAPVLDAGATCSTTVSFSDCCQRWQKDNSCNEHVICFALQSSRHRKRF